MVEFLAIVGWGFIGLVVLGVFSFLMLAFLAEVWNAISPPRGKEHRLPAPPRKT